MKRRWCAGRSAGPPLSAPAVSPSTALPPSTSASTSSWPSVSAAACASAPTGAMKPVRYHHEGSLRASRRSRCRSASPGHTSSGKGPTRSRRNMSTRRARTSVEFMLKSTLPRMRTWRASSPTNLACDSLEVAMVRSRHRRAVARVRPRDRGNPCRTATRRLALSGPERIQPSSRPKACAQRSCSPPSRTRTWGSRRLASARCRSSTGWIVQASRTAPGGICCSGGLR